MSKKRAEIPHYQQPIIETHCHLDYLKEHDTATTLAQAQAVGVERIITIGVSPGNLLQVKALAAEHDMVWGTQGIHPHEAEHFNEAVHKTISDNLPHPKIVAVGEIGLDYYYDHADRNVQKQVFEQQLQLAVDHDLPVVIHTREADDDTRAILQNFSQSLKRKGVIHSFTSSLALAEFCINEGFCLGFNGIATFNKAENVREVIAATPVDAILLETDAPYLTPGPYRGKEQAPCYLPIIGELIAKVKGLETETVLQHAYQNSLRVFFSN